jgi:Flp pilus assembly protein TadG
MFNRFSRRRDCRRRRGATAVEFAITAPILFLLFFGALEFSRANMLKHTVNQAAYEGARAGMVPGATEDKVTDATDAIMNAASAFHYTVDVDPSTITQDTEEVTVRVDASMDENSWLGALFFSGQTFSGSCTLKRERYETISVP